MILTLGLGFLGTACRGNAASVDPAQRETFASLLKEYKRFPEFFYLIKNGAKTFDDVDPRVITNLSESVQNARYQDFNVKYKHYLELEKTLGEQLKKTQKRLEATPLSDLRNRGDLELKTAASKATHEQIRRVLFLLSVDANTSILEALKTVPADKRIVAAPSTPKAIPKLPGVFGGARQDRLKMSETEKINLTPIDDEFYATQLGKKLQADLGGKADYWSYDFDADELYVSVGGDTGKVRVREDSPGIRYIQTKVGPDFMEPAGSVIKVDSLTAQGRFLTGNPNDETLFGKFPKSGTPSVDENPSGSSGNGPGH